MNPSSLLAALLAFAGACVAGFKVERRDATTRLLSRPRSLITRSDGGSELRPLLRPTSLKARSVPYGQVHGSRPRLIRRGMTRRSPMFGSQAGYLDRANQAMHRQTRPEEAAVGPSAGFNHAGQESIQPVASHQHEVEPVTANVPNPLRLGEQQLHEHKYRVVSGQKQLIPQLADLHDPNRQPAKESKVFHRIEDPLTKYADGVTDINAQLHTKTEDHAYIPKKDRPVTFSEVEDRTDAYYRAEARKLKGPFAYEHREREAQNRQDAKAIEAERKARVAETLRKNNPGQKLKPVSEDRRASSSEKPQKGSSHEKQGTPTHSKHSKERRPQEQQRQPYPPRENLRESRKEKKAGCLNCFKPFGSKGQLADEPGPQQQETGERPRRSQGHVPSPPPLPPQPPTPPGSDAQTYKVPINIQRTNQKARKNRQEEFGTSRRTQEEVGTSRRRQEEIGTSRRRQEEVGTSRRTQGDVGGPPTTLYESIAQTNKPPVRRDRG